MSLLIKDRGDFLSWWPLRNAAFDIGSCPQPHLSCRQRHGTPWLYYLIWDLGEDRIMHPPGHKKEQAFFPAEAGLASTKFLELNIEMKDGENVFLLNSNLPVCAGCSPDPM